VRQAHGTRAQLAKIEREDATTITANRVKLAMLAADAATTAASAASTASAATAAAADQGANGTSSDGGEADATAEQAQRDAATAAAASATAAAALLAANKYGAAGGGVAPARDEAERRTPAYHLERIRVSDLAKRPGLSDAAAALGISDSSHVRLVKRHRINARFECGTETKQMVRADPDYRGCPWFDAVFFRAPTAPSSPRLAEVRAMVRRGDGDWALLSLFKPLPHNPDCPLVSRGCIRLEWHVRAGATEATLRAVPMTAVIRLAHVVPDFNDLAEREGYDAIPAGLDASVEKRLAMRYFLNAFQTWEVK